VASFDRGTKRQCQHCSTKFYDLNRDPILCPSCGEKFLLEAERPAPAPEPEKPAEAEGTEGVPATEEVNVDAAAVEAGAEVISLDDAEDEESDDEDIPDVEDVEVDDDIGADDKDVFLEEDDDDDKIAFDIAPKSDE